MNYLAISANEWVYPDIFDYSTGSGSVELATAKNCGVGFQILITDLKNEEKADISGICFNESLGELQYELYEGVPVLVDRTYGIEEKDYQPHFPNRKPPFYVYDCIKPLKNKLTPKCGSAMLYVVLKNPAKGNYSGCLSFDIEGEKVKIDIKLRIYDVDLSKENLKHVEWYNLKTLAERTETDVDSPEYTALHEKLLRAMRRMRQNMIAVRDAKETALGDNKYSFDFSDTKKDIDYYRSLGFKYFNLHSLGGRISWDRPEIMIHGRFDAMSLEGYLYLGQYLTALEAFLSENNLLENAYLGLADEPNQANMTVYRALAGLVRKFAPHVKLFEALSYVEVFGTLDAYVPLNAEYQKHMKEFEMLRGDGELWQYVCCVPREGKFINRLLDYELIATRYMFWGNYKYNMQGYLHWAVCNYQKGQNPYIDSCPEHINAGSKCYLPAGDTHLIYPGKDDCYISMRLEMHRKGIEDYELLRIVACEDKAKADEITAKVFKAFDDVEYSVKLFEEVERELLEAAEKAVG